MMDMHLTLPVIVIVIVIFIAGLFSGFFFGVRLKNNKLKKLVNDMYDAAHALLPHHCEPQFKCLNCGIIQLHSEKVMRDVMCRVLKEMR